MGVAENKFEERCRRENKEFLDFLQKLEDAPASFRISALQSKALRKFMKKEFDIKIPAKLYRRAELKSLKTGTKIFK